MYNISPDYFRASGTSLLAGRAFSWHDDTNAPRVAVVNREFASKILGSVPDAVGRYFKLRDGTRVRVVGLVEDGKYVNLTEDQQPAMFLPLLQSPASWIWLVVRSSRDPQQLAAAMRSVLRDIDPGMVMAIRPWSTELGGTLFPSRMATVSLGVLGVMGAMLSITGIFGMAAYSVSKRLRELGIRVALGAQRKEVLQAALGRPLNCWPLVRRQDWCWEFWRAGCWLSSCIRQLPAIRWSWPASFWPCCCWGWWPRGFQPNALCRSIL